MDLDRREQAVVVAALGGGVLAVAGTLLTWYTITVGDVTAPGGSATGLEGRDGRTVLAAGVVAVVAAVLVALRRRTLAAKVGLIAAGAVTLIIAVAGIVDARAKDEEVEAEFGIPADRVTAEVGGGLWMVTGAGAALLVAGALVRNPAPASR